MIKLFLIALVVYAVSAGGAQSWGDRSWQSNSGSNWGGWGGVGRGWGGDGGWGRRGGWGGHGGWGGDGGWGGNGDGGNGGGRGGWGGDGHGDDHWAPAKYEYNYGVSDWKTGDNKEQSEERHGDVVRGQYSFLEADGTKRIVKYEADDKNGFNAKVIREGHAWHPAGWQGGHGKW